MMITESEDIMSDTNVQECVCCKVEIDWDLDGDYEEETENIVSLEVERSVQSPLGGIFTCFAMIKLNNSDNRYTPV